MHDADPNAQTSAPHVLLAGGGSGGHVFPALAIAEALLDRGWQVSYAGAAGGIEARLATARGLPFYPLAARPVVGQGLLGKARALAVLAGSALSARALVRRLEVAAVVGTGGYVAAPAVLGGRLASRPVLLLEPNAQAGVANRVLSRLATEAALAYASTAASMRCPTTVTGVPVRADFFDLAPPPPLVPGPPRLLVLGGSQGAAQLNELVPAALAMVAGERPGGSRASLSVLHQCGPRHLETTRAAYAAAGVPAGGDGSIAVEVVPFLDDMPAAIAPSHLVVSRAGAITLAELCAAGRPSVLVPLAIAGGHQADNAAALAAAGAARTLVADAATPEALAADLRALLLDDGAAEALTAMATAARGLAHAGAAATIADRVASLVEGV